MMMRTLLMLVMSFALLNTVRAADDAELGRMQGKWEVKKTNDEGQKITQTIEIKKDKMLFKILSDAGDTVLVATANIKPRQLGSFSTFTITNLKYGQSEDSLNPADEDRSYIYHISLSTFTIVSNIDEEREEPPALDAYRKV